MGLSKGVIVFLRAMTPFFILSKSVFSAILLLLSLELRSRLTVGLSPLKRCILVRVQAPQLWQEVTQAKIGQKTCSNADNDGWHDFGQPRSRHDARGRGLGKVPERRHRRAVRVLAGGCEAEEHVCRHRDGD